MRNQYTNLLLLLLVALPPVCVVTLLNRACQSSEAAGLCWLHLHRPVLMINLLWLLHVDVTFYFISLAQVRAQAVWRHRWPFIPS